MLNISFIIFLLTFLIPFCEADDLLSARCQSRCLFKFETKHKENQELRRQLKHQIVNLCKEDAECSSCVLPCRETTSDNSTCFEGVCKDSKDAKSCHESCAFLVKGFKIRPGECPNDIPVRLDECSAACNRDGDCPGAHKCCKAGCSRLCVAPLVTDKRVMPLPESISVQERKRKRSAIVRWVLKKLSKAHMSSNANLYVIQWRWGIRKDANSMTLWQTIMVKNKMYAILKHLLMPGRYYIFRVAAVNQYGSIGFSTPSAPFKLSKEVKAPSSPKNLTVESMMFDDTLNRWIPKLTWIPPASDLPIKDYQLSWWRSSTEFANAYEQRTGKQIPEAASAAQQSRRSTLEDDDYSAVDESIEKSLRSSTIIPSYATKTQLNDGLDAERVYMVELFATVESTEGELRGEPAVVFVQTTTKSLLNDGESVRYEVQTPDEPEPSQISSTDSTPTTTEKLTSPIPKRITTITTTLQPLNISKDIEIFTDENNEPESRNELDIRTPYFEASHLQTSVSWLDSPACSPEKSIFAVRLTPKRCTQTETRLLTVTQCVAIIKGLEFDCEYEVEVDDVNARKVVSRAFFQTLSCDQTPATESLNCNYTAPTQPRCRLILPLTALCEWPISTADPSIIGYQTILSSPHSSAKIGVASTHSPRIQFDNLLPNTDYRFRLQPVSDKGLIPPIDVEFSTRSNIMGGIERRLDKFPILELPLESNSPHSSSNILILAGLFILRILLLL